MIPNPWDVGSAKLLAQLGFKALATTSSGFAWTLGRADNDITLDQALDHFRAMSASVDVPVNADFEGGFAVMPAGVAANVAVAASSGIAGLSIEDSTGNAAAPLYDFELAVAAAVHPKPVNVLVGSDFTTVAELRDAGVRRISVGGALARAAWTGFFAAAREIAEHGTFAGLTTAIPGNRLEGAFAEGSSTQ